MAFGGIYGNDFCCVVFKASPEIDDLVALGGAFCEVFFAIPVPDW